jgi:hypothetical protein
MWRGGTVLVAVLLFVEGSASAQNADERLPPPQAVQGWTPTAPQVTTQQPATNPWQLSPPAQGVPAGAFTLYPGVTGGAFYDDNVFATHSNRQGSWGGFVRPELGLSTAGQNYSVETRGFVEDRWYSRFSSEDQVNGAAAIAATVMPDPDTQIVAKAGYVRGHESRGTGESLLTQFDQPVGYDNFLASGALNKRFDRWWTSLGVAGSWVRYDTPTIGGIPVDQSYRDGVVSVVSGRLGYVVAPLTSVFVEVSGNHRDFQVDIYDSHGYRVVGGVLLEQGPGATIKGEAYAGYMGQDYTGVTFNPVSTWTYGGALAWLLAPQWTANFQGSRNALESSLNGGVSLIESVAAARLDYQIMPNVIVGAGLGFIEDEFLGAGRTDSSWNPLVSVKYLATPNVTLGFDYTNISFGSSGIGVSTYYRNVYLLSINARL